MRFDWDEGKAAANLAKHRVSFDEAVEVFSDPNAVGGPDTGHSAEEARFFLIGYTSSRLLFVVFAERYGDVVRLISARKPTPAERRLYEEAG